jgi:hypothetical protein
MTRGFLLFAAGRSSPMFCRIWPPSPLSTDPRMQVDPKFSEVVLRDALEGAHKAAASRLAAAGVFAAVVTGASLAAIAAMHSRSFGFLLLGELLLVLLLFVETVLRKSQQSYHFRYARYARCPVTGQSRSSPRSRKSEPGRSDGDDLAAAVACRRTGPAYWAAASFGQESQLRSVADSSLHPLRVCSPAPHLRSRDVRPSQLVRFEVGC